MKARGRSLTLEEVAEHNNKDDGWIVVSGKVYDITKFVQEHQGWTCGCSVSTLLAILRVLGTDCSEEFNEVHEPRIRAQLKSYYIGDLQQLAETATEGTQ